MMDKPLAAALLAVLLLASALASAQDVRTLAMTCAPCHGNDGVARDTEVPHLADRMNAISRTSFWRSAPAGAGILRCGR